MGACFFVRMCGIGINKVKKQDEINMEAIRFEALGVSEEMMDSVHKMEFVEPTEVQARTIGPFLQGKDLLVQSPTGTGKTGAFGLPMLQMLDGESRGTQALVLCPTRELALQVTGVLKQLAQSKPKVRVVAIYGGESINKQLEALRATPQIIVATPGRLLDHMQRRTVKLQQISTVVVDEVDRMLDMGFRNDLRKILSATPRNRQTVMYSATLPREIVQLAGEYQKDAQCITIEQTSPVVDTVEQYYAAVYPGGKDKVLFELLKEERLVIVFVNAKYKADKLRSILKRQGIRAAALHGDMKQNERDRVMRQFRNGEITTLVATDVAARGLDVQGVDAVINYDIPQDNDSYVHRIGRTGRAQRQGLAYTLLFHDEADRLRELMRRLNTKIAPLEGTSSIDVQPPSGIYGKARGQSSFHSINTRRRRGRIAPRK